MLYPDTRELLPGEAASACSSATPDDIPDDTKGLSLYYL